MFGCYTPNKYHMFGRKLPNICYTFGGRAPNEDGNPFHKIYVLDNF